MKIAPPARVVLALAAAQWCACAQPSFTAAVFNLAGAPDPEVRLAVRTAQRAFRGGRIESRWVICGSESCQEELPAGAYLELFIMPRLRAPIVDGDRAHPAGYAMEGGFARPRAYAFYDAARSVADRTLRPLYLVLGCILIHETGHLLGLHHQPHGAMRADLEAADMDYTAMGRAFNSQEKETLRAAILAFSLPTLAEPRGSPPAMSPPGGARCASPSTSASSRRAAPSGQPAPR